MVEIICTFEEFHKYIGPRVRNVVQSITKKRKKELKSICQECKKVKELEAAHVKGSSRKDIIEIILKKYVCPNNQKLIKVDLNKFEKEIIEKHRPLEKYFKFLCSACHTLYDSNSKSCSIKKYKEIKISPTITTSRPQILVDSVNKKAYKQIR